MRTKISQKMLSEILLLTKKLDMDNKKLYGHKADSSFANK